MTGNTVEYWKNPSNQDRPYIVTMIIDLLACDLVPNVHYVYYIYAYNIGTQDSELAAVAGYLLKYWWKI